MGKFHDGCVVAARFLGLFSFRIIGIPTDSFLPLSELRASTLVDDH